MTRRRVDQVVASITDSFEAEVGGDVLLGAVAASGPDARLVLAELLRKPSGELRSWAIWAAIELLGTGQLEEATVVEWVREHALTDRDPDTRDEATRSFIELAPDRAREMIPRLRARLRSKDYGLPVASLWMLFNLGDRESIPWIEEYMNRMGTSVWQGKEAEIVLEMFDGRDEELAQRIASHDHDMMHVLCRAARIMRTPALRAALAECVRGRFDPDCDNWCTRSLHELEDS